MKTKLIIALFLCSMLPNIIMAQTKLLHYWHFNNTLPASGGGGVHFGTGKMNTDYTRNSLTTGYLQFLKVPNCVADTGFWDNNVGDSINQRQGYGSCCPLYGATVNNSSVRTRNPNDSMQFLWYIPTKNFKNIKLTWEAQSSSSNSGPHRMNYSYSIDSGLTYITTNLPKLFDSAVVSPSWGKIILNLSGISSVNNSNKLILKLRLATPNTGSSGNNRFDNITVEGDSINVITGLESNSKYKIGYNLFPNPSSSDYINIITPNTDQKNIKITNVIGEMVLITNQIESNFSINISQLSKGIYFLGISDLNGNEQEKMKFIKD